MKGCQTCALPSALKLRFDQRTRPVLRIPSECTHAHDYPFGAMKGTGFVKEKLVQASVSAGWTSSALPIAPYTLRTMLCMLCAVQSAKLSQSLLQQSTRVVLAHQQGVVVNARTSIASFAPSHRRYHPDIQAYFRAAATATCWLGGVHDSRT